MRNYRAFLKKELLENARTYKLFIMLTVFFVFGMMSPLTAKLLPEILSSVMPAGMNITLADPTAIDSWMQFFKNISQMGLIVTIILFSGSLSTELSKGTLINMLTKGLSRSSVILSKFTAIVIVWTLSYVLAFVVTLGYTFYLFPGDAISNLVFSVFCLWLFGIMLLSILVFASTLFKSNYGALLTTAVVVGGLMIVNIFPKIQKYNPLALSSHNVALLSDAVAVSDLYYAVVIAGICTIVLIIASVVVFRKRQL